MHYSDAPLLRDETIQVPRTEDTDFLANILTEHVKRVNGLHDALQARHTIEREALETEFNWHFDRLTEAHVARKSLLDMLASAGGLHGSLNVAIATSDVPLDTLDKELALLKAVFNQKGEALASQHRHQMEAIRTNEEGEYIRIVADLLAEADETFDAEPRWCILRKDSTAEHHFLSIVQLNDDGEPMYREPSILDQLFGQSEQTVQ